MTWRLDDTSTIGGHPRLRGRRSARRGHSRGNADRVQWPQRRPGGGCESLARPHRVHDRGEFAPAADAAPDQAEQRFLHIEESDTGNRALLEIRDLGRRQWTLDTYLKSGAAGVTLIDRERLHPSGEWHVASLVYDGATMTHYVDGRKEASAGALFVPLASGRTAIGMRMNRVSWFKGQVRQIRITPRALTPDKLLRVN